MFLWTESHLLGSRGFLLWSVFALVQSGSCWLVHRKPALVMLWTKAWSFLCKHQPLYFFFLPMSFICSLPLLCHFEPLPHTQGGVGISCLCLLSLKEAHGSLIWKRTSVSQQKQFHSNHPCRLLAPKDLDLSSGWIWAAAWQPWCDSRSLSPSIPFGPDTYSKPLPGWSHHFFLLCWTYTSQFGPMGESIFSLEVILWLFTHCFFSMQFGWSVDY